MNIPSTSNIQQHCPLILSKPHIVGYMSVNVHREYHSDLSQLKFLTSIPEETLDLNHNIHRAVKRTTDQNDEKISLLLKFLLDQGYRLSFFNIRELKFITYRRTLISVMDKAFIKCEPMRIMACLYNGSIYLCSLETEQKMKRIQFRTKQEATFCAWGYKFEQYLLSDLPNLCPNIENPVIENEEFSLYYHATLGKHELLYCAQIDGLLAINKDVPDPPKTISSEDNLQYLRNNDFVELKTNREIQSRKQEQNFRRFKLLWCWCQCYLANLKGLLVGFRNDDGIIQRTQWFDTNEIVEYCKNEWNPQTALSFLDNFLSYVKRRFKYHVTKLHGPNVDIHKIGPISLQFDMDENKTVKVSENYDSNNMILPDWYIDGKITPGFSNM